MAAMFPIYIIVVAAGTGSRFGATMPKQYCMMGGRPVLMHTIDALRQAAPDAGMLLVISPEEEERWATLCNEFSFNSPQIAFGGATRWESVKNGLNAIPANVPAGAVVLIHDGARPLVDAATVKRVAGAAINTDGAIPAIPVSDSLRKLTDNGVRSEAVDRADYRAVQTPQGFALWRLREAYSLPYEQGFTDDASVMAAAGFSNIVLVEGSPDNIKITNPRDIVIAEALLKSSTYSER